MLFSDSIKLVTIAPVKNITKILVANRGEVAVRIMRTAKEMSIPVVSVYSEANKTAIHTLYADEAIFIGGAQNESYLDVDKILETAKQTGANAIHSGYGFLSENAVFAEKVEKAGLIFIGPLSFCHLYNGR